MKDKQIKLEDDLTLGNRTPTGKVMKERMVNELKENNTVFLLLLSPLFIQRAQSMCS